MSQNRCMSCRTILFKCGGEKKIASCRVSRRICLHYVLFRHFCYCTMKSTRGLSRGKIEFVFRHFTKFNNRKMDTSQNSIYRHENFLHFLGFPLFSPFKSPLLPIFVQNNNINAKKIAHLQNISPGKSS